MLLFRFIPMIISGVCLMAGGLFAAQPKTFTEILATAQNDLVAAAKKAASDAAEHVSTKIDATKADIHAQAIVAANVVVEALREKADALKDRVDNVRAVAHDAVVTIQENTQAVIDRGMATVAHVGTQVGEAAGAVKDRADSAIAAVKDIATDLKDGAVALAEQGVAVTAHVATAVAKVMPDADVAQEALKNAVIAALPTGSALLTLSLVDVLKALMNAGWKEGGSVVKIVVMKLLKEVLAKKLGFGGIYSKDTVEQVHGWLTLSSGVVVSVVALQLVLTFVVNSIPLSGLMALMGGAYVAATYSGYVNAGVVGNAMNRARGFYNYFRRNPLVA